MTLDELIVELDWGLRTIVGVSKMSRPVPIPTYIERKEVATNLETLSYAEQTYSAALMRVNHVGEICAQALYQAQKLITSSPRLKDTFDRAAREEADHLAWTARRLQALNSRFSLLNPIWYIGAFSIGCIAGCFGDKISLGFMAETEHQVEKHLSSHLERLPAADHESRAIIEQMRNDEVKHGKAAIDAGGIKLPFAARALMKTASQFMTRTAYYL